MSDSLEAVDVASCQREEKSCRYRRNAQSLVLLHQEGPLTRVHHERFDTGPTPSPIRLGSQRVLRRTVTNDSSGRGYTCGSYLIRNLVSNTSASPCRRFITASAGQSRGPARSTMTLDRAACAAQ